MDIFVSKRQEQVEWKQEKEEKQEEGEETKRRRRRRKRIEDKANIAIAEYSKC